MKFLTRSFLIAGVLLISLLTSGAQSAPVEPTHKTVLVLSPFQIDLSTNLIAAQAMREEFGKATDLSLDVYYEYLDLNRFPDPAYQQKIFDLLAGKYKNKRVDLVIVGSEAMLKLWLAQRVEILPDTPIVFLDVFTEHLDTLNLPANVTGVSGVEDCEKSLRWAFAAMPGVKEMVLVGGVGKIEQGFLDHIQKLQEDMQGQVKFTNLSGLPLEEIKQRVSKLLKSSIVLYHPVFEDTEGTKYHPLKVLRELTAVSSVPVISGYDQFIGTGIIGGYMYSIDQQARDGTQVGLRVLRDEAIRSIPIAQDKSNRFIFDHLALQRFDIPLSLLPSDSMVKNRQYSFWELYQPQIIAACTGIAFLLLLVVFLLGLTRQLNRTRLALAHLNVNLETQVQERTALLNQTNSQLQDEITDRKQAEEQLRESEEKFRGLLDSQESNIMMLDFDGVHHYVNQVGVASMTHNGTAQDIIGKGLHDLFPSHIADWQLAHIRQVFTTGQGMSGDFENVVDKQSSWWHLSLQPIRNASGEVVQVMVNSLNITERTRAEQALRETEERFHTLADTAPVLIWMSGTDSLCRFFNQPWLDFTGRTIEQELENGWREGIHADDLQRSLDTYLQAFQTRQAYSVEYRLRRADGEYRWIVDHGVPRFLPDGCFVGYIGSCLDISDRKRIEEELRDSDRRTATILRLSPIVIGVSTVAEGRYTDVNDAFERVLGYSQAETIGRTSHELNIWVDGDTRSQILRDIQAHGRVENLEIRLRRKSGEIFPALIFITPIALHDTPCLLAMMMDITDRKRVEEQLRETRDAMQTIFHSSPLAILTLDAEDRVSMWNPAAEAMFGWSDKQILGKANPTVPENKSKEYEALRQATLSGMAFSNLDTLRMKKDGTQFPVSLSVAPLRGQQSQVIGRMHVIADITERKKMQEELRQQATTDELTRISNRRHFIELAHSELKRAVRLKRLPAIALIDIDHFKQINDTFGHAAGDQALIGFTQICRKQIREIDVFARLGGDEFVLLLPETTQEQAYVVIERIRLALTTQQIDIDGKTVALTISSGITSFSGDQESIDTLLSQADQALYRAKEKGRNNVVRYDELCQ